MPVAELDRVTGVVASLRAHDGVEGRAEKIDDLPFALVSPLQSDDAHVAHCSKNPPQKPRNAST